MIKRMFGRKGQNTAEYAILIALVVGAVIAMQTYVQRAMQGRTLDTSKFMADATQNYTGNEYQYEPYYQNTNYESTKNTYDRTAEYNIELNSEKNSVVTKTGEESAEFNRSGITDYGNGL